MDRVEVLPVTADRQHLVGQSVVPLAPVGATALEQRSRLGAVDALAFLVPAMSFVEFTIIGRLVLSELVMLALIPLLWSSTQSRRPPAWLIVLWSIWLIGQIISDVVAASAFPDLARGWAGIAFTLTNLIAMVFLVSTPRRARMAALGLAVGGLFGYLVAPIPNAETDPWKWGLAFPIGIALAAALSGGVSRRGRLLTVGVFIGFGILNFIFGFRSLGGVSLVTAGWMFITLVTSARDSQERSPSRFVIAGAALVLAGLATVAVYDQAASRGLLGTDARLRYETQSGGLGVLVGGRSEILASTQAVIDSPLLGHGSWARDYKYVDLQADRLSSLGYEVRPEFFDFDLIPAHSYLLGSWVWSGIAGAAFWIAVVILAFRLLGSLTVSPTNLAPLMCFTTVQLLWNIAFSPYGTSGRIFAPFAIALCLLGLRLRDRGASALAEASRHHGFGFRRPGAA